MAPYLGLIPLLSIVLLASGVPGAPTPQTQIACAKLKETHSGKVYMPGEPAYTKENRDYFNIGLAELGPACIVKPSTAQEVSSVVKLLREHETVPFAVKSGGYSPNPGHSSVRDGVLIALRDLAGTEYDTKTKLAYIKPGGHWTSASKVLMPHGRTVVSARFGMLGFGRRV
jgi:FAD/FMN-containing dehydrogenase